MKVTLQFRGQTFEVELEEGIAIVNGTSIPVLANGHTFVAGNSVLDVQLQTRSATIAGSNEPFQITALEGVAGAIQEAGGSHGPVSPPMTGTLQELCVSEGDAVSRGDVLFVLEAMKMQNEIKAAVDGVVRNVQAAVGNAVDTSSVILHIEED